MAKILLVEDDKNIVENLSAVLGAEGFQVRTASGQREALKAVEQESFDLLLLDVSLKDGNGFAVCSAVKGNGDLPVIFLTASGDEYSVVTGLELGAEDYITKPFELMELLARVETVLRRCGKTGRILSLPPDIEIDTASRKVTRNGVPVALTAKEYDLLLLFVQNKNIALYRDRIYERVWGEEYLGDSRTVDLHIQRMRKKLGLEDRLVAVYKIGYRLEV